MTTTYWFILIGCLLLARGVSATLLERSHFTSSIFYLAVGLIAGPTVLGLFRFDPLAQSRMLETLTEVAVLISLFSAGVKMPVPVRLKRWSAPLRLAGTSMVLAVGLVAVFAHLVFALPWGAAILLGAILAPTDPVLATDVQSRHPGDRDRLRFTLTCEAGMNDGTAFPFVMLGLGLLGLHELGDMGSRWVLVEVLWATLAAVAIGIAGGAALAHLAWKLRERASKHAVLDDLVGLGLIALVYGVSVLVDAWGFLSVFFTGVALRQTELKLAGPAGKVIEQKLAAEAGAPVPEAAQVAAPADDEETPAIVSAESLIFSEHLERLSELLLILLLGGMLSLQFWSWRAVGLAVFVFLVARPVSVIAGLLGSGMPWRTRLLAGWFGVRGIGSVYYLMYAIQHGLPHPLASELVQFTLTVITLSIVVHGGTVKFLLDRYDERMARQAS